ncbi:sensor histidine kinase [Dactylosporangium sp. CA-233914]|uniref:sensor histidine kinase n=1 Tax=Dactylosporangium sp. CA-233914 TaxID=3239934 RepID=UPI003D942AB8
MQIQSGPGPVSATLGPPRSHADAGTDHGGSASGDVAAAQRQVADDETCDGPSRGDRGGLDERTLLAAELEFALRRPRPAAELVDALRAAATDTAGLIALADTLLAVGVQAAPDAATAAIGLAMALPPVIQRYRNAADLTGTTLRTDLEPTPPVRIDPARLERITTNLLDNATRHGAPPITIATSTTDGYARLTVHDTGPGMPAQFLPHAAERFARADTARTTAGTGLGLSLVDAIVAAHDGHLWWCSGATHHPQPTPVPCTHPATGTTITVLLPAAPEPTEPATGTPRA